jgi:hypothetical protein
LASAKLKECVSCFCCFSFCKYDAKTIQIP